VRAQSDVNPMHDGVNLAARLEGIAKLVRSVFPKFAGKRNSGLKSTISAQTGPSLFLEVGTRPEAEPFAGVKSRPARSLMFATFSKARLQRDQNRLRVNTHADRCAISRVSLGRPLRGRRSGLFTLLDQVTARSANTLACELIKATQRSTKPQRN
jgi:hypothetical protein